MKIPERGFSYALYYLHYDKQMYHFTPEEESFLKSLDSPAKIQGYLDSIPFNFEKRGETCMSPRRVLQEQKAHCIEGAMLACAALMVQGELPLILNLKVDTSDVDHVVTLYKRNGYWGAISKTNHSVLRFRDPVYRSVRELAMSYFHEYFLVSDGSKTMKGFSKPVNLRKFGTAWLTSDKDLWHIAESIFDGFHYEICPPKNKKFVRPATALEREAASIPAY